MEEEHAYLKGEWIVHSEYGVGQVKGVVKKEISGKSSQYVKIKARKSTFWLPVSKINKLTIRPLSTPKELQQAISFLQEEPQIMSSNYKERHKQVQKARTSNTLAASAQMLRDLRAQSRAKGNLTTSESRAWRELKQQLVEEWAIVSDLSIDMVEPKLEKLLNDPSSQDEGSTPKKE